MKYFNKLSKAQQFGFVFAVIFLLVFIVTNIPAFNDAQGRNFGLFKIDPIDNVVHFLTAVIGFWFSYKSVRLASIFMIVFGTLYMADAAVGMLLSRGLLDLSVFTLGPLGPDFSIINWLLNLPHIAIAAVMLFLGFKFKK